MVGAFYERWLEIQTIKIDSVSDNAARCYTTLPNNNNNTSTDVSERTSAAKIEASRIARWYYLLDIRLLCKRLGFHFCLPFPLSLLFLFPSLSFGKVKYVRCRLCTDVAKRTCSIFWIMHAFAVWMLTKVVTSAFLFTFRVLMDIFCCCLFFVTVVIFAVAIEASHQNYEWKKWQRFI